MILVAALVGYIIGSLPTAGALGRVWGVQLRESGSGNPGANNALRLGGPVLAATVLLIEVSKGLAAVVVGLQLAGDPGAVAGAVGAVTGNVYNVWYKLDGGKGLGISLGVLAGIWPTVLPIVLAVLVALAAITRSSGTATIASITALNALAVIWWAGDWSTGWGVSPGPLLVVSAIGIALALWRKHRAEVGVTRPILR